MTTTVKVVASTLKFAVQEFDTALEKLESIDNILFSLTFEPIPVSMIEQSKIRGANAMRLKLSDGPLVIIMLSTSCNNIDETEKVYAGSKEALRDIEAGAEAISTSASYRYLNYAFPGQDVFASYGKVAKNHLLVVS